MKYDPQNSGFSCADAPMRQLCCRHRSAGTGSFTTSRVEGTILQTLPHTSTHQENFVAAIKFPSESLVAHNKDVVNFEVAGL